MVFTKKTTKSPSVMVETKKLSGKDACGMGCCKNMKHCFVFILILLNTLMLVWVLINQNTIEAAKVGGRANYKMVQQIYKSETFKAQQSQQIEQALQMYQGGVDQNAVVPAATDAATDATTQVVPVTQ